MSNDVTDAEALTPAFESPAGSTPTAPPVSGGPRRELWSGAATLVAFLAVFAVYSIWLGSDFLDVSDRMFDISRSTPQFVLAIGVVVCLSCHQFDLSVGSMATLAVFLTVGLNVQEDLPLPLTIAIALAVGAAGGLVNGLLVTRLRMNAFIATLGTGGIFGGLTVVYSQGRVIGPTAVTGPLPSWFTGRGSLGDFQQKVPLVVGLAAAAIAVAAMLISFDQRFPPRAGHRSARTVLLLAIGAAALAGLWAVDIVGTMSWTIVVLILISTIVWVLLKYTGTGRAIYAVGGSVRAALFAGIRTDGITVFAFVVSGTTAALAGVLLASVQGSAVPGIADALLLPAYASAFLSTVLISRGRFHVWGAVVGGIFLVYVASGLIRGGVAFTWTQVINGAVLVLTVSLSTFLRRR